MTNTENQAQALQFVSIPDQFHPDLVIYHLSDVVKLGPTVPHTIVDGKNRRQKLKSIGERYTLADNR